MFSQAEDDLSCSVCQEIFKDPVVLQCSHSFCRACLQCWWSGKQIYTCPLCKDISPSSDPPCNLVLKNLCEGFLLEREQKAPAQSEDLCPEHHEKLRLFCLEHLKPICLVCRDSNAHRNHRFVPINEAVLQCREELNGYLMFLKEKLDLFNRAKDNMEQTAGHIRVQAERTEKQIKDQFKKLYLFLKEEEAARISALREEEERKRKVLEEKIQALNSQISAMSEIIRTTDDKLVAPDISFLLNYQTVKLGIQRRPLLDHTKPVSGVLLDEAKHLGNLVYDIWIRMKAMVSFFPVIMDPNTAHPKLVFSDDLSSVTFGPTQKLPDNPERFDQHLCVLGSEGFDSGTHHWDVEVGRSKCWGVGVIKESAQRKGQIQTGYWEVCLTDGNYEASSSPQPGKSLSVKNLQRIRVQLDFSKGRLSFIDLDTNKVLHTFRHSFNNRLFPYFANSDESVLKILPAVISAE
ncbi:PREDICTED: zinc-binding protein A33-like [Cyprinodon variegatus]|uniref:zinc-binding protein A33-like n=1 Tax=Cyprinodon variegatus TaxID=28743 RepID=UPI0007426A02|nr:PREDICTED: zinc-binding protein A33-like [Cyprinodon variegatus]